MKVLVAALLITLGTHGILSWFLSSQRPTLEVLPPPPSRSAALAASFGDEQFLYRSLVLNVQNAGDTGGRFTPMDQYDGDSIVAWLGLLQKLDQRSHHYTALAVRYFSQARKPELLRQLIDFVDGDVDSVPEAKWYWQTQIIALARDRLNDRELALSLSRKMQQFSRYVPSGYMWTLQMEPVLLYDLGRYREARAVMEQIVATHRDRMNTYEWDWTQKFLRELPVQ